MDAQSRQVVQASETLMDKSQAKIKTASSHTTEKQITEPTGTDIDAIQTARHGSAVKAELELIKRDKLLSTGEAAVVLGLSKSEFKRRLTLGMYVATYVAINGWHFFSHEYLATFPGYGNESKSTPGPLKIGTKTELLNIKKSGYTPEEASRIFQALDNGMSSREIVIKLLVHPDTMMIVYEAWKQLGTMESGGIQISAKTLEAINELPLPGTYPVTTEEQLLANLREASKETPMCNSCHKQPCRLCPGCAEAIYSQPEVAPTKKMGRPKKAA